MRDFEDIRDEIMGSIENRVRSVYNKGYDAGYNDGYKKGFDYSIGEAQERKYREEGLNEAWECVRRINNMTDSERYDIFGDDTYYWEKIFGLSALEAITKIKEYDKASPTGAESEVQDASCD